MNLVHDWKRIIKRTWSIRLAILSALLSGLEMVLPLFGDVIPRNLFAALSFITAIAAGIARVIAQPRMYEPDARTDPLDVRINPIGRRR